MDVSQIFPPVVAPDDAARSHMAEVLAASPRANSYGRLNTVAEAFAGWHGQVPPEPITQPRVVVFAGDHGVAQRGVSGYGPEASVQQATEILAGGGPVNTAARAAGASVRLVDVSLDHEAWGDERVSRSCPPIDEADAMTEADLERALLIGQRVADQEIDAGADLLIPGDLGVANTTVAAALMGALTPKEPVAIVGPGSGVTDEMWKRKVSAIRDAMFRVRAPRGQRPDPLEVLRRIGSPDIAALTGFIAQAAGRRTPVLVDATVVTVAAYLAHRLLPGVEEWLLATQLSPEPAHFEALDAMKLTPLLALDLTTGQAVGGVAALPLIRMACELASEEMGG